MIYIKDPEGKVYILGIRYPEYETGIRRRGYFYIGPRTKVDVYSAEKGKLRRTETIEMPVYPTILAQKILMSIGNCISNRINRVVNSSRLLKFLLGTNPIPRLGYYVIEEGTENRQHLPSVYRSRKLDHLYSSLSLE